MVQVHSGPLSGVIAQLVERQLCKLDVRSSSLLSSSTSAPGRKDSSAARRWTQIENFGDNIRKSNKHRVT